MTVHPLTGDAVQALNSKPCLIFLGDNGAENVADFAELEGVFREVLGEDTLGYVASAGGFTERIRGFTGVKSSPAVVALDLASGGKVHALSGSFTASALGDFVKGFKAGTLAPFEKSEDRPENDRQPDFSPLFKVVATSFKEVVLDEDVDFFLDVYADWCGPCKAVAPQIAKVAYVLEKIGVNDKVKVGKIDADGNHLDRTYLPETGIPNMKLFSAKGNKVVKYQGNRTAEDILRFIHTNGENKFDLGAAEALLPEAAIAYKKAESKNVHVVNTDAELAQALAVAGSEKLAIIDCFAEWCGPCQFLAPM